MIEPLGFTLDHKKLRRAGLDYHEFATLQTHPDLNHYIKSYPEYDYFLLSSKATKNYTSVKFKANTTLIFGNETQGLTTPCPKDCQPLRIPMKAESRCLNLANSVSIALYEVLRQQNFNDLA